MDIVGERVWVGGARGRMYLLGELGGMPLKGLLLVREERSPLCLLRFFAELLTLMNADPDR
jgi:hypothetical protein